MPASHVISWDVSTDTLPDAFERYIVGMADLYEVSGISDHDRRHFYNRTRSALTESGVLGQGRSVRQTLSRGAATLRRSDLDGLNLLVNNAAVVGDADGREIRAAPGAIQFRDLSRPTASRVDLIDVITVLAPRAVAPPSLIAKDAHGLVIPPDRPGARLLKAHLTSLMELSESLSQEEIETAIQAAFLIAVRITGLESAVPEPEMAALQRTVRRAAGDYIEARLNAFEPTIDNGAVARAAGVSRATLYRAFDTEGGVNRYVQDRRLQHARRALRRRMGPSPTIADIAYQYGFASPTHFSRQFRACFGYSPSEVEPPQVPRDVSMSNGPIRHDLLVDWLKTLESRLAD
ncbi:DNA-binding domain-containing protein, AraC-type [Caulobacter sp. AP07]|uniref:AraC family transcriptional regulator n=1 Tax=Caulobacter sp. AP07 TaxID=1144304 RepID=UPI000271FD11|nr:helix-turn-helix domain-containing protein [Caulobacter sp. AP07]EJL22492.1 DNA-binding domain-containing protein, AraC-type [Caulobacter sp. AP07]